MKFKTTDKVVGEIVLGGLNLILKKNATFDVSKDKTGHHELVWAIHNGYVTAVDIDAQIAAGAKKKVYVNNSKRTIVSTSLKSPLMPGHRLVMLQDDPTCYELDKLVEMNLISVEEEVAAVPAVTVKDEDSTPTDAPSNSRKSFKKKPSSYKPKTKEKVSNSDKLISESKPTIFKPESGTIFVGENNEEIDI
jgi:hypothetical protein